MNFSDLLKNANLLSAVQKMGFTQATLVQEQTIPMILAGHDVLGCAQTGTGKTAAFLLPILQKMIQDEFASCLILVPTRELAEQIHQVLKGMTAELPDIRSALLIGGSSMRTQAKQLADSSRVLIATPGRLIDHLGNSDLNLKAVKYLVLDEADRMLDMGFLPQINEIQTHLDSGNRQTILFSATMPEEILQLAKMSLKRPKQISLGEDVQTAPKIEHKSVVIEQSKKDDFLLDEINRRKGLILIFTRTQLNADHVTEFLKSYGVEVVTIHGGKTQGRRSAAVASFRSGDARVLVATDIAARGLDIPGVEHVINYDIPVEEEDFVHRIGRTGRAGRSGQALSMVGLGERRKWLAIERLFKLEPNKELAASDSRGMGSGSNKSRKKPKALNLKSGTAMRPRGRMAVGRERAEAPPVVRERKGKIGLQGPSKNFNGAKPKGGFAGKSVGSSGKSNAKHNDKSGPRSRVSSGSRNSARPHERPSASRVEERSGAKTAMKPSRPKGFFRKSDEEDFQAKGRNVARATTLKARGNRHR